MIHAEDLKWGQTPWDDMPREELTREMQRAFAAVQAMYSILNMYRLGRETQPYWGTEGTGGWTLEMGRQVIARLVFTDEGRENLYHCFYRYANDLLFDCSIYRIGFYWAVCPECGVMIGAGVGEKTPRTGAVCKDVLGGTCVGVLHPLTWDDLQSTE